MTSTPLLNVKNLNFQYPHRELFKDFSVDIYAGVTIVTGDDGCGKTSFLQLLAGVLPLQGGQVVFNANMVVSDPHIYSEHVFWVDAHNDQIDNILVKDYLASLASSYQNFSQQILEEAIAGLALDAHLEKQFFMLSTGTKRKVWLAAALSAGCTITVLDDAFAGVDKLSIQFFITALNRTLAQSRQAWIISTYHQLEGLENLRTVDLGANFL